MPSTEASRRECLVVDDKFERCVRKCIVFPADGSATRTAHMIVETVTAAEDISALRIFNRCVDLTSTYGAEHRNLQTRIMVHIRPDTRNDPAYIMFCNRSPRLPINLNVAKLVGVSPSLLKSKKRMFWRGDIVAMKVRWAPGKKFGAVEALDAHISELGPLEERLQEAHRLGFWEGELHRDELQWKSYVTRFDVPGYWFGAPTAYWGENAAQKEEQFLSDVNEQRCGIQGRAPLIRPDYMKSNITSILTQVIYSSFQFVFPYFLGQKEVGQPKPKLPPELERQIFETCALDYPEICTNLVLVSKRVYTWIDPILITTVYIDRDKFDWEQDKLKSFLARLTNGKHPMEYYARHVKNLAFFDHFPAKEVDDVLAICTGVENLAIRTNADHPFIPMRLEFFNNPQAGASFRRLCVDYWQNGGSRSPDLALHACFRNLTHLHLIDDYENWPFYTGWEHLTHLTHLAFKSGDTENLQLVINLLPVIRFVALCHSYIGDRYGYINVVIHSTPELDVRVVLLSNLPPSDWERGARGKGDFWNAVEDEVERRLREGTSII